jgi:hypothetical protein
VATPEAGTEVEAAPKYSAEDLRDPTKRADVLTDYLAADIAAMSSDEVDAKLEQALSDGLVRPKLAGDEVRGLDDTFSGKMELESTIPEVQDVLNNLKDRKLEVVGEDTENAIKDDMVRTAAAGADKATEMVTLFEQAYRKGDVTLVETKAAVAAKGSPGKAGYTPGTPAEYAWRPANRREAAIKQAFERQAAAHLTVAEKDAFLADTPTDAGRHRGDLDRQAKEERAQAKTMYEQHQKKMAEEARKRIEDAEAKAAADKKQEQQDKQLVRAKRSHDVDHKLWEGAKPRGARKGSAAYEAWARTEPQLSEYGSSGQLRMDEASAEAEAWASDQEAREKQELFDRYQQRIDAETDVMVKKQLEQARTEAIKDEKDRQEARTAERGQIRAEAINMATTVMQNAQDRVSSHEFTVRAVDENGQFDPRAMDRAGERLRALGIGDGTPANPATPFLEMNHGRVREAYYRVPGNDNIVVFERYDRRTGAFMNQTVITTHDGIRPSRISGYPMPPREVRTTVDEVRAQDELLRRQREGNGIRRLVRAGVDYGAIGVQTSLGATTGAVEGPRGPYAQRGMNRLQREAMRGRAGRHGGFFFWFWNR